MSDIRENRQADESRIENREEALALLGSIEAAADRIGLPFVELSAQLIREAMERGLL
jgi:hypothetical protein